MISAPVVRLRLFLLAAFAALALGASPAWAASPNVVISQIYGGGGNSGAPYTNDYIELFNRGSTTVVLTGWSLQYASATGTGNFGSTPTQITELASAIGPGQYMLVHEGSGGTSGAPLPGVALTDPTPIAMGATGGKVALVNTTTPLGCNGTPNACTPAALATIVDLVGYGNANYFEGAGATPAPSNTTAAFRLGAGCTDTDNNAADFAVAAPNPRTLLTEAVTCPSDAAPAVSGTSPASGASNVPVNSDVTITFSEPVTVSGSWYTILCGTSGDHPAAVSGGPTTYTLDPTSDFASNESCTVTIDDGDVSDNDGDDPPDTMAADHAFSFTTTLQTMQIGQVQGASHLSPFAGQLVQVEGIVIAERGSNVWIQDPSPDADSSTSEAILVFGSSVANAVVVGDLVEVSGTVVEFRAGCSPSCSPTSSAFSNLTITELAAPGLGVTKLSSGNGLPAATVIGVRPTEVIEDDSATGNVETSNTFDPAQDGIDFYETLEHMRVQVNDPVVVGPRNGFGEILVLADDGAGASVRTVRGGILVRDVDPGTVGDYEMGDFNPERIMLDDLFMATPSVNVADHFTTSAVGVMTYDFANFKIAVTSVLTRVDGGLEQEVTRAPLDQEIVVGTYNVENLDPTDGSFARHAGLIVNNLRSPDVIAIEEIQDNDGAANTAVTDASVTWNMLISAIQAAGGPIYEFRQIDPVDDQDGGQPGGNIRVGFLFRTDRGVSFIDRPGGDSTTPTTVVDHPSGPQLSFSPGRVDPQNPAWEDSRKPLAGEFRMHGRKVFVIANHLASKGGDQPLFGRFQPPTRSSEVQRHQQAQVLNDFVDQLLAADANANVVVAGDINDFEFSETVAILGAGGVLTSLMETLPQAERYSYVFEGNSQVLDQILVSPNLLGNFGIDYDPVHVNSEFADQASDHDPQVARLDLRGRPAPKN
jgi:predicted extracellular nuclease